MFDTTLPRDLETVLKMIEIGVTRFGIGVQTSVAILDQLEGRQANPPTGSS